MEGSLPQKPLQHQERMAVLLCHCPADLAEPSKAMLQRGTRAGIQAQLLHSGWQEVSNWTLGAMERWLLTSETAGSAREPAAEQQWVTNLQSSPGEHRVTASSAESSEGWTHSPSPSRNSAMIRLTRDPLCEDRLEWPEKTRESDLTVKEHLSLTVSVWEKASPAQAPLTSHC